jgi:hypothetical protein
MNPFRLPPSQPLFAGHHRLEMQLSGDADLKQAEQLADHLSQKVFQAVSDTKAAWKIRSKGYDLAVIDRVKSGDQLYPPTVALDVLCKDVFDVCVGKALEEAEPPKPESSLAQPALAVTHKRVLNLQRDLDGLDIPEAWYKVQSQLFQAAKLGFVTSAGYRYIGQSQEDTESDRVAYQLTGHW